MYGTKSNRMIKIPAVMLILYSKIIPEKTDHINTDENDDNNNLKKNNQIENPISSPGFTRREVRQPSKHKERQN